jgi:hypothetical protein
MKPKLLKTITILLAVFAISMQVRRIWIFLAETLPKGEYSAFRIAAVSVSLLTYLVLPLMVLLIVWRSRVASTRYLTLFLAAYCTIGYLPDIRHSFVPYLLMTAASVVVGNLFILSFQHFPVQVTVSSINSSIRFRWLRGYLRQLLNPKILWTYMLFFLLALYLIDYVFDTRGSFIADLIILSTGMAFLLSNYLLMRGRERDRIVWLLWGLAMYILLLVIFLVLFMFEPPGEAIHMSLAIFQMLVLLFSFVMSLFFYDAFDTRIFVRRTAVNAAIFVLVIFVYNTAEHYLLHWVSHTLHISNVLLSSLLSGMLVLFISPLHHRLTHFLNRKLKREVPKH